MPLIKKDIIIVGGGPSGSTLGWKLKEAGHSFLILDKEDFPRKKPCAGWIKPDVLRMLKIDFKKYPHSIRKYGKLIFFIKGKKIVIPTIQYSIRRFEFDNFLLKRAGLENFRKHRVENIEKFKDKFVIDGKFESKIIVGAGGTYCPVYTKFFKPYNLVKRGERIVAMEEEFKCSCKDKNIYLWFFDNELSGYGWYVPKDNDYLNVGIGGKFNDLKKKKETIKEHWDALILKLEKKGLVPKREWRPEAHQYNLLSKFSVAENEGAYIIGDSLGVSTLDMGEGISNSVRSALQLYNSIKKGKKFKPKLKRFSITQIIFPV